MAKNSICLQLIDPVLFQNDNKICQISNEGNAKQKKNYFYAQAKVKFFKKKNIFQNKTFRSKIFQKKFCRISILS